MTTLSPPDATRNYVIVRPGDAGGSLLALDSAQVRELLETYGAILFRGYDIDVDIFRQMTASYCFNSVFNNSPGRRVIDKEHNIQTVNLGAEAFPLHPELSREPWKPDVAWFACMTPPGTGGETTLCDGVEIVRRLSAGTRSGFAAERLRYVQPVTADECQYWFGSESPSAAALANPPANCPFEFSRQNSVLVRAFTRPALHRPMFSDELAFGNFLFFARYGLNNKTFPTLADGAPVPDEWVAQAKSVSDTLTVPVHWQRHDLVMLDNTRFMHGRNKIENIEERLILSYFGYLTDAPLNPEDPPGAPWRIAQPQGLTR